MAWKFRVKKVLRPTQSSATAYVEIYNSEEETDSFIKRFSYTAGSGRDMYITGIMRDAADYVASMDRLDEQADDTMKQLGNEFDLQIEDVKK